MGGHFYPDQGEGAWETGSPTHARVYWRGTIFADSDHLEDHAMKEMAEMGQQHGRRPDDSPDCKGWLARSIPR